MEPWWMLYPDRLQSEIDRLERLGHPYRIDDEAKAEGRLVVTIDYPYEGATIPLVATFPASYPYFRFDVAAPELALPRHRNFFNGNLCLLTQDTINWSVDDHLADFLRDRVPIAIAVANDPQGDFAAAHEERTGDPIKPYIDFRPESSILVERWNLPLDVSSGELELAFQGDDPFRGAVKTISHATCTLGELSNEVLKLFPHTCRGRWVRLPQRPITRDPWELKRLAEQVAPGVSNPSFRHGPFVLGIVYQDELQWRAFADDWIFLVIHKKRNAKKQVIFVADKVISDFAGREDLARRVPELRPLAEKIVLLVGLGSLGSSVAIHLARAGVKEIRLLDFDTVSVGNTVRWALGWGSRQVQKSEALARYINSQYPYTLATPCSLRIGQVTPNGFPTDLQLVHKAMESVDLVFDASAEWGVRHFLADLANAKRLPFVWSVSTPGLWGGIVGRIVPGKTPGCIRCYDRWVADDTIRAPVQKPDDGIQIEGCSAPSFTGAGIDAEEVAVAGARFAISTLCLDETAAYPSFDFDVAVLDLRRADGSVIAPKWDSFPIPSHPKCSHP